MRYVAVSQPTPWSPMEIIGVGETMDEAYSGARAWFENAFDKFGEHRWNELVAMQNNLNAVSETVLHERTGVTLDEWLARLASAGQDPGAPQPPKPPMSLEPMKIRMGWEPSVWILLGILVFARPLYWLVTSLRAEPNPDFPLNRISQDALPPHDLASLLPAFGVYALLSVVSTAVWFWLFRLFKSDASLMDYVFFIFILRLAGIVVGFTLSGGQLTSLQYLF